MMDGRLLRSARMALFGLKFINSFWLLSSEDHFFIHLHLHTLSFNLANLCSAFHTSVAIGVRENLADVLPFSMRFKSRLAGVDEVLSAERERPAD